MDMYLLIHGGEYEDAALNVMDEKQLREFLANPDTYGVTKFLHHIPSEGRNYWDNETALLLKIQILKPVQVQAYVIPELDAVESEPPMTSEEFKAHLHRCQEGLRAHFVE